MLNLPRNKAYTKTISITSGKGGVGKTTITANLAKYLALKGKKVLIFDGDLGMANVDVMYGKTSPYSVLDVIRGDKFIEEIIVQLSENVYLIPGGSGVHELSNLGSAEKQILLEQVGHLNGYFDYLLVDTAPGIDSNVLYLNSAVHEICVVLTPEPSSLTDSYALIKVLNLLHKEERFSIIMNEVGSEAEALEIFKRLNEVCERFLFVSLDYLGAIPNDSNIVRSTRRQTLVIDEYPYCLGSKGIFQIGDSLQRGSSSEKFKGGLQFFWQQVLGVA